jgi:hypothetical protein
MSSSRANPLSARNRMLTRGHRRRICATTGATSCTEPAWRAQLALGTDIEAKSGNRDKKIEIIITGGSGQRLGRIPIF